MASPLLTMVEVAAANGCPKRQAMRTEYKLIARREARELARRALKIEGLLDACKESLNRWEDDSRWAHSVAIVHDEACKAAKWRELLIHRSHLWVNANGKAG